MASHLTVTTTTTAGVTSARSFNGGAGPGSEGDAPDIFAALLGATGKPADAASAISDTALAASALDFDGEGTSQDADPQAIAALLDAPLTIPAPAQTGPLLADIIDGLATLQARLAAGEPLDSEALNQLDAALADLAKNLGITQEAPGNLAALPANRPAGDDSFEARLAAALAPFAETLLAAKPPADARQAAALKAIGDKLAALLAGLAPKSDTPEPVLATPELKLTEPVLTGKSAARTDAATAGSVETADAPFKAVPTAGKPGDGGTQARTDEHKPAEPRPAAIATSTDKQPEPPSAAHPAPAARIDMVAAPRVVQVGYQTSQQQLNLPQIAFELVRQAGSGNTRFQIRLDPPELGKIDVRLDIDASGKVHARLTVEKAETLDLMQRDQRGLERALQQAGLDGARTSLEFSLRQNPFSGGRHGQEGAEDHSLFGASPAAEAEAPPPTVQLYRGSLSASGLNIIA